MEALIRSAQLAPFRKRLGDAPLAAAPARDVVSLRVDVEQQVRAELSAQLQEQCAVERERARVAGLAAAKAEAQAELATELQRLHAQTEERMATALRALEQTQAVAWTRLEANVGEVAFAAVCHVVGHQAASRQFVLALVERACQQLRGDTRATVRLHPRDVEQLRPLLVDAELRVGALALEVKADPALELGGCVLDAPSGCYEGGLEQQLRRLHGVLNAAAVFNGEGA